jgi:myo-inositol-1(or 4)-monophosphatase
MSDSRIEIMKSAARSAGAYIKNSTDTGATQKSNSKDFVTVADIKSQQMLRAELAKSFPDAIILSEEDSETQRAALYAPDFTGFVLDPIDGTYNFKHDMRESSVSVGYIENGQSIAGVIFDPYKDELFEALRGNGAWRNGKQIRVSAQQELASASVAFSNSYDEAAMARTLKRHLAIYETSGIMPWTSCPGSGVLVMAWIACGRIDAYHHNGIKPWDNAAAFLLVREAGGIVQTLTGADAPFTTSTLLVGTPTVVAELRKIFDTLPEELLT